MNDTKKLTVSNFSVEKAFLELLKVYKNEGAEQAGKEFLFIIKGVDDNLNKEKLLERFYLLSENMALLSPSDLSIMLKSGKVLKDIYNASGLVLSDSIEGINGIVTESAYIIYFLQNDFMEISKYIKKDFTLSEDVVFSGSVVSVLLKTLYDEYLSNKNALSKHIKRKEEIGEVDLSQYRVEKEKLLEAHFFQTLKKIREQLFSADYVVVVEDLKNFLKGVDENTLSDLSSFMSQIQEFRKELKNQIPAYYMEAIDTELIPKEEENINRESEIDTSGAIEKMMNQFEKINNSMALSSDVGEVKIALSEIEDAIAALVSKMSSESNPNVSEAEDYASEMPENSFSAVIDKIEQLERVLINFMENDEESIVEPQVNNETSFKIEELQKAISDISDEIEESKMVLAEKVDVILPEVSKKIGEIESIKAHVNPEGDDTINEIKHSVSQLNSKMSSLEEKNEEMSQDISSIMELVRSLSENINDEIEIAKKYRKENGYEE